LAGENLTLSVEASGSGPLQYQWFKNGNAITGAASATLFIPFAEATDAGTYTARVVNSAGSAGSEPAVIVVLGAPAITLHPQSRTVAPGDAISLAVEATGSAPLRYQWMKNGAAIPNATSSVFQISSAGSTDAGSYTVKVSNGAGSVMSAVATVRVLAAPSINVQPQSKSVALGANVSLSVQ